MRTSTEQYVASGVIFGLVALVLLAFSGVAFYAAFTTYKPVFVPMGALFGIFGCISAMMACFAFSRAMVRS
jgi:hypothetical protein